MSYITLPEFSLVQFGNKDWTRGKIILGKLNGLLIS